MSIRPEIPYLGNQTQRLTAAVSDMARDVQRLKANNSGRETKGHIDVTFTASNQANWAAPSIASPSGAVAGVANSGVVAGHPTACTVTDGGSGSIAIICWTIDGTSVSGTTRIYYHIWPY